MQLFVILAFVLAFSKLLTAEGTHVDAADIKLAWSTLAWISLIGLAWWIAQVRQVGFGSQPQQRLRRWIENDRLFGIAYLLTTYFVFVVLDLAEVLHTNWGLQRFFLADDLAVGVTITTPLLASWLLMATPSSSQPMPDFAWRSRRVIDLARLLIVLPLAPVLLLACISDLHRFMMPAWEEQHRGLLALAGVLAIVVLLPVLLRWCWPTSPLRESPELSTIEGTLRATGVRVNRILCWNTRGQIANAAISGFLPCLRYLFVTDELLRRLETEQLRMITAHEAAHCRCGHLPRLALSLVIPFLVLLIGDQWLPLTWFGTARLPILVLVVLGAWGAWHGRWARLLEHQADIAACQVLSAGGDGIQSQSVRLFEGTLAALGASPSGDWLHPAPIERIRLLDELVAAPTALAQFQGRVRRATHRRWYSILLLAAVYFVGL